MRSVGKINKALRKVKRVLNKVNNIQKSIKSPAFAFRWHKKAQAQKQRKRNKP